MSARAVAPARGVGAGGADSPGALAFVLGAWGLMTAALLAFTVAYGADLPTWDEWANAEVIAGAKPLTPSWLWSQHNEHRIPLPRLVSVILARITGADYRAPQFLNALALSASALILIVAARRQRGGSSYADVFISLILANIGHFGNVLYPFQVQFTLSTLLISAALAWLACLGRDRPLGRAGAIAFGLAMILLPLCGANGIAPIPALAVGVIGLAINRRGREPAGILAWLVGSAILASAISAATFIGYQRVKDHEMGAGVRQGLVVGAQVLANGWGQVADRAWPASGWAVGGIAAAMLAGLWWGRRRSGEAAWGLLVFAGGMLSLAVGLGMGRAGLGDRVGFVPRYVSLLAPLYCAAFLAFGLIPRRGVAMFGQFSLAFAGAMLLWPNSADAVRRGREFVVTRDAFLKDLHRGEPPYRLIARYGSWLHPSNEELTRLMPVLREAKIAPFDRLAQDPPMREIPVEVEPARVMVEGGDGSYRATGVDPYLIYSLPEPRLVCGIRFEYSHRNEPGSSAHFECRWRDTHKLDPSGRYFLWYLPTGEDRRMTIWTDAVLDEIRIQPDNQPCDFKIRGLTLLVPEGR